MVRSRRNFLKRAVIGLTLFVAALVVLFEAWLVFLFENYLRAPISILGSWLNRIRAIARFERWLCRRSPYQALGVFVVPAGTLLPFKVAATVAIAHGHVVLGAGAIVCAKLVGTALVARIWQLCRPQLLTIPWFARLYDLVVSAKTAVTAWVHDSRMWRRMAVARAVSARRWRQLRTLLRRRSRRCPRSGDRSSLS